MLHPFNADCTYKRGVVKMTDPHDQQFQKDLLDWILDMIYPITIVFVPAPFVPSGVPVDPSLN